MAVVAPATLDSETQLEWEMWVGRRVWARYSVIGIVVGVARKVHIDSGYEVVDVMSGESRQRSVMDGRDWLAKIEWTDDYGVCHGDLRDLSWLRSVDRDLDTRTRPCGGA